METKYSYAVIIRQKMVPLDLIGTRADLKQEAVWHIIRVTTQPTFQQAAIDFENKILEFMDQERDLQIALVRIEAQNPLFLLFPILSRDLILQFNVVDKTFGLNPKSHHAKEAAKILSEIQENLREV